MIIGICACLSTAALLKIRRGDGGCAEKSPSVRVVCLPPLHTQLPAGFQCTVSGYGRERHRMYHSTVEQLRQPAPGCFMVSVDCVCFPPVGSYSKYLKKTQVSLISHNLCQSPSYYGKLITDNMLCAGSPDWTTDSCSVSFQQIFARTAHVQPHSMCLICNSKMTDTF